MCMLLLHQLGIEFAWCALAAPQHASSIVSPEAEAAHGFNVTRTHGRDAGTYALLVSQHNQMTTTSLQVCELVQL